LKYTLRFFLFFLFSSVLFADDSSVSTIQLRYAKNFTVEYTPAGKLVRISNAWRNSGKATFTYLLTKDPFAYPRDYPEAVRIQIPVTRVALQSTTCIPQFVELGVVDTLVGISDTNFVNTPIARKMVADGMLRSIGRGSSMNTETLLALRPDLLISNAIGDVSQDSYSVLNDCSVC